MRYEIHHTDGRVDQMMLVDTSTTAEAEVAKWHPDQRATVSRIVPVAEFTPTVEPVADPSSQQILVQLSNQQGLPPEVTDTFVLLAQKQRADSDRIAALERTIAELRRATE